MRLVAPISRVSGTDGPDLRESSSRRVCRRRSIRFSLPSPRAGARFGALTWTPPAPPAGVRSGPPGGAETAPPLPAEPALWARMPITVASANITGVQLALHQGSTVSGHIVFDGSGPAPVGLEAANLRLEPVGASLIPSPQVQPVRLMADGNGRITSASITHGRYVLRAAPVRGWTVESATTGDRDIVDDPIDIRSNIVDLVLTMTDRPLGTLAGSALGDGGQPATDASVIGVSSERQPTTRYERDELDGCVPSGRSSTAHSPSPACRPGTTWPWPSTETHRPAGRVRSGLRPGRRRRRASPSRSGKSRD